MQIYLMRQIKSVFLLIAAFFFFRSSFAQSLNQNSVAKIGNIAISKEEYIERYELTPFPGKENKNNTNAIKLQFLYTLVAEKLWALESEQRGFDTSEAIKFSQQAYEKMFVLDGLFSKKIKSKVEVSEAELIDGLIKNSSKLKVNFLFSTDEDEIRSLYKLLNSGIPFDSILGESPELEEQKVPIEVVYGQMERAIEDSLYNLKVGSYTSPILTADGWYIFKLADKSENLLSAQQDVNDAHKTVKEIIEARKTNILYKDYYGKFFGGIKVDINLQLLNSLSQKIADRFSNRKQKLLLNDSSLISLEAQDVLEIEKMFGPAPLAETLIYFKEDPVVLKTFIRTLVFDGFSSQNCDFKSIHALLGGRAKTFIEQELLAREGYKQNLHLLPEVQEQVKKWKQNYLFQVLQNQFVDSAYVNEDEIYQQYLNKNKPEYYPLAVNIVEILTDSLEIVEILLNELKSEVDIRKIAKKYSKREWTKKKGGEFGFFPITMYGEIGEIAATMEIGEIYGPLKVPEGYSIFKLIDKREERTVPPQPFEKVKSEIEKNLKVRKIRTTINSFTSALALKYGVNINYDLLESLEVTSINSFGYRTLGFGGRITAAPLVSPNYNWVEEWLNSLKIMP